MSKRRHWKQTFSADAPMVLRKRMKLNGVQCERGTEITDEMKAAFGRNRLRVWWDAGFIERSDFEAPVSAASRAAQEASGPLRHVGNGWYEVDTPGGVEKIRGKTKAEELLASITSDPETPEEGDESIMDDQPEGETD